MLKSGMFATFKLVFVYLTLGLPAGLLGIPYSFLIGDIGPLYRVAMWITNAGVRAAGIKLEVTGFEHVPVGRSCIFMCNHVSNLDPPVLLPLLPGRCSVLLKQELMNIPVLGTAMRMAQSLLCADPANRAFVISAWPDDSPAHAASSAVTPIAEIVAIVGFIPES